MAPTFVDLFCGIGGFRIGLEAAGFECVYANDIDENSVEVYKKNRQPDADYPVECADIREVFDERPDNIPPHHLLAAGFPCNSFAPLGNKLGEKCPKYGNLGGYVVKVAAAKRPVVVLLENVPMFFRDGKPWFKNMVTAFDKAGYVCCSNILAAWHFGLPQHRRRGFIVAVRKDVPGVPFKFPQTPQTGQVTLRSFLFAADSAELFALERFREGEVTMRWKKTQVPAWSRIIDTVPDGPRRRDGVINLGPMDQIGRVRGQIYHDLGHYPCVRTSASSSYYRHWIFTRGTDDEGPVVRRIHPQEVCRIQGFPDDFELHHAKITIIQQLGNAVPPPMVEWIGHALLEQYRQAFVDEDDHIPAKTPKGWRSSRKSHRKSKRKSNRKSGQKSSRKRSRKSRHKLRKKSSHGHTPSHRHKSSGSNKPSHRHKSSGSSKPSHRHKSSGSNKPSRKRRFSSDSDEAPPPKRQHRQFPKSPDSQSESSTGTAGFDGNTKASASPGLQSGSSTSTAEPEDNVNASTRSLRSQSRLSTVGFDGKLRASVRRRHRNRESWSFGTGWRRTMLRSL